MRKIDLIIENIRDEYMINLLEEGESTELESLKTKKFLNESLGRVRSMLIEEGAMDSVKNHLSNNWGKYLAGAGAAGAGYLANEHFNGAEDIAPEGEAGPNTQIMGGRIADAAAQNAQSNATQDDMDEILNPNKWDNIRAQNAFQPVDNSITADGGYPAAPESVPGIPLTQQVRDGASAFASNVTDRSPMANYAQMSAASDGMQAAAGGLTPEQLRDPETIRALEAMAGDEQRAGARLGAQGLAGAGALAGVGAAGYGAKKLANRYGK